MSSIQWSLASLTDALRAQSISLSLSFKQIREMTEKKKSERINLSVSDKLGILGRLKNGESKDAIMREKNPLENLTKDCQD